MTSVFYFNSAHSQYYSSQINSRDNYSNDRSGYYNDRGAYSGYQNDNYRDNSYSRDRYANTQSARPPTVMGDPGAYRRNNQANYSTPRYAAMNDNYRRPANDEPYYLDEGRPRSSLLRKLENFLGSGLIYGGVGIGRTRYNPTGALFSNDATGKKIYFGFRLSPSIAVEGSYYDFGKFEGSFTTSDGTYYNRANYQVNAYSYSIRGSIPLEEKWNGFAKIGMFKGQTKINGEASTTVLDANQIENSLNYGIGAEWIYNPSFSLRFELEYLGNSKTSKIRLMSIGTEYSFD